MQEGKWGHLKPFAEAHILLNPSIPIIQVAELAIARYGMEGYSREAVRKIISRLLNEGKGLENQEIGWIMRPEPPQPKQPANVLTAKITTPGTYVILGCWHVPFDNKRLTDNVAKLIQDIKPQGLILNGDFLDCNSLSGHDRGKFTAIKGLTLDREYELGEEALDHITESLPSNSSKVYLYGNHEDRWNRQMADMQNAKTPPPSPRKGLNLDERGFLTIESFSSGYITLGQHLDILHGIYYNTHCAKTHIDRFRGSVLFAHTHRIQSYIEGHTGGFNIGWGGDAASSAFNYADRGTKASWQNGFGVVHIDEKGAYYFQQVIANGGKFYFNGKFYN